MKTFTVQLFCYPNKMNLSKLYLNKFPTMKNYLPSFSVDEAKKLYLLLNKNSKCLLYKFNDWIELLGAEKILIRHSSEAEDAVGLKKREKRLAISDRKNHL